MVITNPTQNDIKVQIEGIEYKLPASGELKSVPAKHALYWKTKLHSFIQVKEDVKELIKDVKVLAEEVVDVKEAAEEVVEDVKVIMKKVAKKK